MADLNIQADSREEAIKKARKRLPKNRVITNVIRNDRIRPFIKKGFAISHRRRKK